MRVEGNWECYKALQSGLIVCVYIYMDIYTHRWMDGWIESEKSHPTVVLLNPGWGNGGLQEAFVNFELFSFGGCYKPIL